MTTNPTKFVDRCSKITPAKAIEHGTSMAIMKKTPEYFKKMHVLIQNLEYYYGVKERLSPQQIAEMNHGLARRFWYLKLEELIYVFTKAKTGFYGSLFKRGARRIDSDLLSSWIDEYDRTERQQAVETVKVAQSNAYKNQSPLKGDMQELYERYKQEGEQDPAWKRKEPKEDSDDFQKFKAMYFASKIGGKTK